MDSLDKRDEDEHDHHIEGSITSCNNNFLTIVQVLDSTKCEKKKSQRQTSVNSHRFIVHNAHLNRMQKKN
jgi:hypothetical protein